MQVVANERLVKRESRIGAILLAVTFGLLGLGMFLSFQPDRWAESYEPWVPIVATYAIVLFGMGFFYLGNSRVRRYGPQHRQDERLRSLLKGLDNRYVLFAFLGHKLPDYILVGPSGVSVLTVRPHDGEILCRADRWSRATSAPRRIFGALYGNPIGSPSDDTGQGVQRVRALLREKAVGGVADTAVSGLVVFTADRVRLRVERCSFPATTSKELRRVISKLKGRLNQAQQAQVRAVFEAARSN